MRPLSCSSRGPGGSGAGLVFPALWKLKPPQGHEKSCLPGPVPRAQTGNGCDAPEGVLLPFTQKVPRRQLWKVNSNNGPFQCPDSSPSAQLADTANSNSAAFSAVITNSEQP